MNRDFFASSRMQHRLVQKVFELGGDQYFVEGTDEMRSVTERLSKSPDLEKVGKFRTYGRFPILKLPAGATWRGASCSGA